MYLTYIAEKVETGPVHEGETVGVKDQLFFFFFFAELTQLIMLSWKNETKQLIQQFLMYCVINIQ